MVLMLGYESLPKPLISTRHLVMPGVRSVIGYKTLQYGVDVSHQIAGSKVLWNMVCSMVSSGLTFGAILKPWNNYEYKLHSTYKYGINMSKLKQQYLRPSRYPNRTVLRDCFLTCYRVMMSWFTFPSSMHWLCSVKLEDMWLMNCKEYERWRPWNI
jgi:hypothetical protein